MNIFKQFWQRKKYSLLWGMVLISLINFIIQIFKIKENALNFCIFYIIIPLVVGIISLFIEKRIRKRKEADS